MPVPIPAYPVVKIFSLPKDTDPPESVIDPSASVKFPMVDPLAKVATPAPNVPVVAIFSLPKDKGPPESVIDPLARVKFPIEVPVAKVTALAWVTFWSMAYSSLAPCPVSNVVAVIAPENDPVVPAIPALDVKAPDPRVPVVTKFSLPKDISPVESVIDPVARVNVPSIEAVSATVKSSVEVNCSALTVPVVVISPVVVKFSLPKSITPPESVMDPLANVRLPIEDPDPSVETPAPNVPVVARFSLPKSIDPELSIIDPPDIAIVPIVAVFVIVILAILKEPTVKAPDVVKFSLPKSIVPLESVIDPSAKVRFPAVNPPLCTDCAVNVATPVTPKVVPTPRLSPIVARPDTVKSSELVNCSAETVPLKVPDVPL